MWLKRIARKEEASDSAQSSDMKHPPSCFVLSCFFLLPLWWPQGPGQYDAAYLAYVVAIVRKCAEHGISVFVDPHQDVWSR